MLITSPTLRLSDMSAKEPKGSKSLVGTQLHPITGFADRHRHNSFLYGAKDPHLHLHAYTVSTLTTELSSQSLKRTCTQEFSVQLICALTTMDFSICKDSSKTHNSARPPEKVIDIILQRSKKWIKASEAIKGE